MAIGRKDLDQQDVLWIATDEIARVEHVFYRALNKPVKRFDFDAFVEGEIARSGVFSNGVGRPSVAPGIYFRVSLVGYFEGLPSEHGAAWWCADSIALRDFLGYSASLLSTDRNRDAPEPAREKQGLPGGPLRRCFRR
ncbi:MAG: transposase [Thermoanaerobaculia bacterium]